MMHPTPATCTPRVYLDVEMDPMETRPRYVARVEVRLMHVIEPDQEETISLVIYKFRGQYQVGEEPGSSEAWRLTSRGTYSSLDEALRQMQSVDYWRRLLAD